MATTVKVSLLLLVCVLPAMVAAIRPERNPFLVQGRVYCDTCRAGFETSASTYIAGAEVAVECKNRNTSEAVYSKKGKTDARGSYKIMVDIKYQICDAKLISSPQSDCKEASIGRDRARLILTTPNNSTVIASHNTTEVNAMAFMKDYPLSHCPHILSQNLDANRHN